MAGKGEKYNKNRHDYELERAHWAFLQAVKRMAPDLLQRLAAEVFPVVEEAARKMGAAVWHESARKWAEDQMISEIAPLPGISELLRLLSNYHLDYLMFVRWAAVDTLDSWIHVTGFRGKEWFYEPPNFPVSSDYVRWGELVRITDYGDIEVFDGDKTTFSFNKSDVVDDESIEKLCSALKYAIKTFELKRGWRVAIEERDNKTTPGDRWDHLVLFYLKCRTQKEIANDHMDSHEKALTEQAIGGSNQRNADLIGLDLDQRVKE